MRGYGFMLSRRWALFAVAVALGAYAAWWLGEWQWHRLESRRADNAIVRTNEAAAPAPVADVLPAPGSGLDPSLQWRTVTATGTYDVAHTVIIRYRSDDHDNAGVDVVVPLRTASGTSVLVDRGFLATTATPQSPADVPAPPAGQVTVTGYARVDGTGSSTEVSDQSARAISSATIGPALGIPVYGGFVQLSSEDPASSAPLAANDLPDLGTGPHFFYALQWWFFGILAVFGFFYLAYDEKVRGPRGSRDARVTREPRPKKVRQTNVPAQYQRPRKATSPTGGAQALTPVGQSAAAAAQSAREAPPSTGTIAPETNDEAGDSRKAAARPNSSGTP